jgi:hypothetical protein
MSMQALQPQWRFLLGAKLACKLKNLGFQTTHHVAHSLTTGFTKPDETDLEALTVK